MAFLDNSGDIILDAVLTDTGRLRLAQGDGSFKIAKFALGDDEINYSLYNKNHASGSAYFDLEILQTPILEAFTNNSSQVKSRLMTISRTNILYMPVLKLNVVSDTDVTSASNKVQVGTSALFSRTPTSEITTAVGDVAKADARFYVCVDNDTFKAIFKGRKAAASSAATDNVSLTTGGNITGCLQGFQTIDDSSYQLIRVDQGLDTNQIAAAVGMDSDMLETAFIVEMDYRLGRVKRAHGDNGAESNKVAPVNFIDDDNIATYYLTSNKYVNAYAPPYEERRSTTDAASGNILGDISPPPGLNKNPQAFDGPRGSTLHLRIEASAELQHSTYLFEQLGEQHLAESDDNIIGFGNSDLKDQLITGKTIYFIDTTVRIIGANTGFRLDVPIRYIKIQ